MSCIKTQYSRKILCAGAMNDYIEIYSRSMSGTNPGQTIQSNPIFTPISDFAGLLEAVRATLRMEGVNLSDADTHVCYIPYDQTVFEMDKNKFFIKITRTRSRWFKFTAVMDWGEQEQYMQIRLNETGFTDLEASGG
jgi:hypothetical protein